MSNLFRKIYSTLLQYCSLIFPNKIFLVYTSALSKKILHDVNQLGIFAFYAGKKLSSQELRNNDDRTKTVLPYGYVLAFYQGLLIGRIKLFKRNVNWNNSKIILGGLGGLCVLPAQRRKGVGLLLLRKAVQIMSHQQVDVMFFKTSLPKVARIKLFGSCGFLPLHKEYTYRGVSGRRYMGNDGFIKVVNRSPRISSYVDADHLLDIGIGIF